jgi:hypothetical protein
LRVCTDGFDALHFAGFDALCIAGGQGARSAVRDERLIEWLRRVYPASEVVSPIGEGHLLLRAAGVALRPEPLRTHPAGPLRADEVSADSDDRYETLRSALMLIKRDLGPSVVRGVAERLLPNVGGKLAPLFVDSGRPRQWATKCGRWRAGCGRTVSARCCGMGNGDHLAKIFRKRLGLSPTEYRNRGGPTSLELRRLTAHVAAR